MTFDHDKTDGLPIEDGGGLKSPSFSPRDSLWGKNPGPFNFRFQHRKRLYGISALLFLGLGGVVAYTQGLFEPNRPKYVPRAKSQEKVLKAPFELVNPQDTWAHKMQVKAEEAESAAQSVREERALLEKRLDVLENMLLQGMQQNPHFVETVQASGQGPQEVPTSQGYGGSYRPQAHQPYAQDESLYARPPSSLANKNKPLQALTPNQGMLHIGVKKDVVMKVTAKTRVPAGSFANAVIMGSVAASTSLGSQSNPQPMLLQVTSDAFLPQDQQAGIKGAFVTAGCYGDLSSERVHCRLNQLTWTDPQGQVMERKVEGWVFGEDGREGLRGVVVDKASHAVMQSVLAGFMSGVAGYFQQNANKSVYPVSPFGQTNAMPARDVMEGAAAKGVGNGFDRVAEYMIKRAESISPVIVVDNGRRANLLFMNGFDLLSDQEAAGGKEVIFSAIKGADVLPQELTPTILDEEDKDKDEEVSL